jgi:hypothetical protein
VGSKISLDVHKKRYFMAAASVCTTLLLILLSVFSNVASAQTSIVAVRTPNEMVVGADSKGQLGGDRLYNIPLCKIVKANNLFFAISGLSHDPATSFDANAVAIQASQSEGTIHDRATEFEKLIVMPLTRALKEIRRDYPMNYNRDFVGKPALQIIFFGFERNLLVLLAREFEGRTSDSGGLPYVRITKRLNCPGEACPLGEMAVYLGQAEAINRFRRENPDSYAVGLVKAVRHLIQLEIDDVPDKVGPPIDVLRITRTGAEWIERKKECPDIQR